MITWARNRRRRREAALVEERVVVAAGADEPLTVVFEPMGSLYEVPAGERLTVVFRSRPGHSGEVEYRPDHASACAGAGGTMAAWTASGAEIDLGTGEPEDAGPGRTYWYGPPVDLEA
ncbi:hypothetical protein ABTZ03_38405 [Kitasatospora sp. NPDC096077]|uniref:hypothetical protein n=1 Tax=unclassified Kitasatospora TaxID=2633591 RepID=UPI00331C70E4